MAENTVIVPDSKENPSGAEDHHLKGISLWIMRIVFGGIYSSISYMYITDNIKHYVYQNKIDAHYIVNDILFLCVAAIALLIFLRNSSDWFVVFSSLALIVWLASEFSLIGFLIMLIFAHLFPNGQRVIPRRLLLSFFLIPIFIYLFMMFLINFSDLAQTTESFFYRLIWGIPLVGAVYSQAYRYRYVSTPREQQKTKWAVLGLSVYFLFLITAFLVPLPGDGSFLSAIESVLVNWDEFRNYLANILYLIFALTVLFAFNGYQLWNADVYINRTVLYGIVTGVLAVIWTITLAIIGYIIQQFTDKTSPMMAAILSSIQIAALFQPVRQRVETWVNNRFYKDRVDFEEAIKELQRENWQFISSRDMFDLLAVKTPHLLKSVCGAIYSHEESGLRVVKTIGVETALAEDYQFSESALATLRSGRVVQEAGMFALLVPLIMPRQHINDLVGILALGPREEERGYSRDHMTDLKNLGARAGTAIHFLKLNENKKSLGANL